MKGWWHPSSYAYYIYRHLIAEACISDWGYEPQSWEILLFSKQIGAIWWLLSVKLLIKWSFTIEFCDRVFNCVKLVLSHAQSKHWGDTTIDHPPLSNIGGDISPPPSPPGFTPMSNTIHTCKVLAKITFQQVFQTPCIRFESFIKWLLH